MAQKFEIYREVGWDDRLGETEFEKLTSMKNEQAAIDFARDINNIGKYGNMLVFKKTNGKVYFYSELTKSWEEKE